MQIYIIVLSFQNNYQPVFYSNTQQFSYPYYLPRAMQYVKKINVSQYNIQLCKCIPIALQMHLFCSFYRQKNKKSKVFYWGEPSHASF